MYCSLSLSALPLSSPSFSSRLCVLMSLPSSRFCERSFHLLPSSSAFFLSPSSPSFSLHPSCPMYMYPAWLRSHLCIQSAEPTPLLWCIPPLLWVQLPTPLLW